MYPRYLSGAGGCPLSDDHPTSLHYPLPSPSDRLTLQCPTRTVYAFYSTFRTRSRAKLAKIEAKAIASRPRRSTQPSPSLLKAQEANCGKNNPHGEATEYRCRKRHGEGHRSPLQRDSAGENSGAAFSQQRKTGKHGKRLIFVSRLRSARRWRLRRPNEPLPKPSRTGREPLLRLRRTMNVP